MHLHRGSSIMKPCYPPSRGRWVETLRFKHQRWSLSQFEQQLSQQLGLLWMQPPMWVGRKPGEGEGAEEGEGLRHVFTLGRSPPADPGGVRDDVVANRSGRAS